MENVVQLTNSKNGIISKMERGQNKKERGQEEICCISGLPLSLTPNSTSPLSAVSDFIGAMPYNIFA